MLTLGRGLGLRNIGIISHINAGKTTTTERILYYAGKVEFTGDVDKGNTITDYLNQERKRGITITSAAVSYNWQKHKINLIDTPGHIDFTIEVERSLCAIDGVVTILDASAGVEAQTQTVWRQASKYKLPSLIFLNKCDKPAANYTNCLKDLHSSLLINPALIQLPVIQKSGKFNTVIDLIDRKVSYHGLLNSYGSARETPEYTDLDKGQIDQMYIDKCEEYREKLINQLSDLDETFASHVMGCSSIENVDRNQIHAALKNCCNQCSLSPVLVGSSFHHVGIHGLMDAVINYLPSPEERFAQLSSLLKLKNEASKEFENKFFGFIFKIINTKRLGPLAFLRIYNGVLDPAESYNLINLNHATKSNVASIYLPFADDFVQAVEPVSKGDIVVIVGPADWTTGDVISSDKRIRHIEYEKSATGLPFSKIGNFVFPTIEPMNPVYYCTIECPSIAKQGQFKRALESVAREDPSFTYQTDPTGLTTIRGMGKLHLEVIRDRIHDDYGLNCHLGPLQVAYLESIDSPITHEVHLNKRINIDKQTVHITLFMQPKPGAGRWTKKQLKIYTGLGNDLENLKLAHRKAIENGVYTALHNGPAFGFPVIDVEVTLMHLYANGKASFQVISSVASQCVSEALSKSKSVVLEPIMDVEVKAPSENNHLVMSDISVRRGIIQSTTPSENGQFMVVSAKIPLIEIKDYSEFIRSTTSGMGSFSLKLSGYEKMSEGAKMRIERY